MYTLILVDYNSLEKTIAYIRLCQTYLGQSGASHVVIVENGTQENPVGILTEAFGEPVIRPCNGITQTVYFFRQDGQQIAYCHSGGNVGYAKGNNLGVTVGDAIWNDPFYIISNNDLVFEKPLDMALVDSLFTQYPDVGIIGPTVITPQGERQSPRYWQSALDRLFAAHWIPALGGLLGDQKRMELWKRHCRDTLDDAQTGYHAWVSGCFFFVRADAFHKAGMFDKNTFLYAEEMIIAKRLETVGSKVFFCREVEVIHQHAQSTKKALAEFQMKQIDYDANYYFYKTYTKTSRLTLAFCNISFAVFKFFYLTKNRIRCLLKGES